MNKAKGYLDMELLRFTTAGSVDDGKSTLIGRLLYDSKAIFEYVFRMRELGWVDTWIGLVPDDDCNNEDGYESRRRAYRWVDSSPYVYPHTWHNWSTFYEPRSNAQCGAVGRDGHWYGHDCNEALIAICEQGMQNVHQAYNCRNPNF